MGVDQSVAERSGTQMSTVARANAFDQRYHAATFVKRSSDKVFPTHWSFLLGEIELYGFVILLLVPPVGRIPEISIFGEVSVKTEVGQGAQIHDHSRRARGTGYMTGICYIANADR
ncbi:hypothetical protein NDR87_04235 [Nocardia sp. CDC159]|uniref:Uncharacterized protein n=1 Tax=Nocardia pulmonis TaxID=2951408 RepID=A0A9X2E5C6_9NOCA|nr:MULTISPECIES: hypothetical protein [Nocardia]MCM6773130.1 hypothetical protein [Nocardia pulmonis]MCM6785567.1 hypothetical protein [Nocardia sp. CDC159]